MCPGPHFSNGSPDLSLVQGAHKVVHNLHEVLEGLGLDSPDLCLADTPKSFFRAPGRRGDLRGGELRCVSKLRAAISSPN